MKKNVIFLMSIFVFFALTACASPGPMQTSTGPMHTAAFRPIILDKVNDGSKEVLFKEYTTMYDDKKLRKWGVFFITDKGVYMAHWVTSGYVYELDYQLKAEEISEILDDTVIRDFWFDSNLLVIKDIRGNKIGFPLRGKIAARALLQGFLDSKK
ncbi:hypothetical protein [Alcanivorax sp. 1008]|uniref:hypothetical protein n=1 Tax=Alcanivorax sp. 1008 TaxID=2816853 RepID=UPI001D3AA61C|nr:hypothetical protein [Alcanivorax sp. 1008]MCC1495886.1 hypothetical protein [Alcanivorax sp. 1008]